MFARPRVSDLDGLTNTETKQYLFTQLSSTALHLDRIVSLIRSNGSALPLNVKSVKIITGGILVPKHAQFIPMQLFKVVQTTLDVLILTLLIPLIVSSRYQDGCSITKKHSQTIMMIRLLLLIALGIIIGHVQLKRLK